MGILGPDKYNPVARLYWRLREAYDRHKLRRAIDGTRRNIGEDAAGDIEEAMATRRSPMPPQERTE